MRLSTRVCEMPFSATRKLIPYAEKAKKNGKKIYHLNVGQPDIKTPEGFFKAVGNFEEDVLRYGSSNGNANLIEIISDYYKQHEIDFEPEDILITNGGSEALMFALLATCDTGDSVLTPEPFYTDYNSISKEFDLRLVGITTRAEDGYHLPSKNEIVDKIDERTKAVIINNPNNPTGVIYTPEEVKMIVDIALEYNLFIISDEVYREFVYEGSACRSFAHFEEAKDHVIIVDSISKRYSACGARIGCMASKNKDLMYHAMKLSQARICPPTLDQIGAIELYKTPKNYFKAINEEYTSRRDIVYNALQSMKGVMCKKPQGAFYVAAKLPVDSAEKFIIWMLENYSYKGYAVLMSPLSGFYATPGMGEKEVRIAYILKKEELSHAMEVLHHALLEYPYREE